MCIVHGLHPLLQLLRHLVFVGLLTRLQIRRHAHLRLTGVLHGGLRLRLLLLRHCHITIHLCLSVCLVR